MQNIKKLILAVPWFRHVLSAEMASLVGKNSNTPIHIILSVANHYEPHWPQGKLPMSKAIDRVKKWCGDFKKRLAKCKDSYSNQFVHTYFYPAEEFSSDTFEPLWEFCAEGFGEIEIHLHHGIFEPDTEENLKKTLNDFKNILISYGSLGKNKITGENMYGFIHGNFALGNINNGKLCGVDSELEVLAKSGCYADFTMPSFPDAKQISKINSIYEIKGDLRQRAAFRNGIDCSTRRIVSNFPLMIQGPLMIDWRRNKFENGCLTAINMPTEERFRIWRKADITIKGRPQWVFIKLHCHGLIPEDSHALLGTEMVKFLNKIVSTDSNRKIHYATCREMFNIIAAGCNGKNGDPEEYKDYLIARPTFNKTI